MSRLVILSAGLWILSTAYAAPVDLFVGNFFGHDSGVLKFDGTTGAFESVVLPFSLDSFPLGGTFGPDGNFYVTDSDTDAVLRVSGTTVSTFASNADDAAGLKFGPDENLYVVNSSDPGSVTKLNGTTGAVIGNPLMGGGLSDPEGITFGPDGNIYVANGTDIVRFNGTTRVYGYFRCCRQRWSDRRSRCYVWAGWQPICDQ